MTRLPFLPAVLVGALALWLVHTGAESHPHPQSEVQSTHVSVPAARASSVALRIFSPS